VRLDHLLSKELSDPGSLKDRIWWEDHFSRADVSGSDCSKNRGTTGCAIPHYGGVAVWSIHCWVLRQHAFACGVLVTRTIRMSNRFAVGRVRWRRVWMVGGVVFENCTVIASIFVVKLLRAYGECLGIRSR
jgi:hypothetical protein